MTHEYKEALGILFEAHGACLRNGEDSLTTKMLMIEARRAIAKLTKEEVSILTHAHVDLCDLSEMKAELLP